MKVQWTNVVAIGVGAAIGTISRYGLNLFTLETGYPFGTLIENLFGSFLLGFLTAWFLLFIPKEWVKLGLGVGLCGGFTTMSTLAGDAIFLFTTFSSFDAIIYIFGSMIGGILFALLGFELARRISGKSIRLKKHEVKRG
ncbi:fluoride efflux transporter FluC [Alkalihalobacillus hemicellulosilyticus]|uniref:fluoride efflux transporter FluC n=1 Tax=Halalkalibacter hemicellulosilyticus TaxID=127886 RepID=UPI000AA10FD9|nr:CrcB family protein [Halalkalibacter hemicellulosilyticus]